MQNHLSNILNHIYQQKFYFRKFHFSKFCPILFDFILLKKNRKYFVMNSVHEQFPISDLGTVLSPKTESKCVRCTKHPIWPSQRAQAVRTWPYRGRPVAVSWLGPRPYRRRGAPYRGRCQRRVVGAGAVSQRAVPRAWLPCPGLGRAPGYCIVAWLAVSQDTPVGQPPFKS